MESGRDGQRIRDAHWFATILLDDWKTYQRSVNPGFQPLPWYREKAICWQAAYLARNLTRLSLGSEHRYFSRNDEATLWDTLKDCVAYAAHAEYENYTTLLAERLSYGG